MANVNVEMADICKVVTVTVGLKGLKRFKIRLWITTQILKFASLMSGFQFVIEDWSNKADIEG